MNVNTGLTLTNFLEVYLLLLEPKDLFKFFSIHSLENKYMWGVDFMFWYYKIKTGIINTYSANHELVPESNIKEAEELSIKYLRKNTLGKYNKVQQIWSNIPAIVSLTSKCQRKTCQFLSHVDIKNNGGTHCCLLCKNKGNHGSACARIIS